MARLAALILIAAAAWAEDASGTLLARLGSSDPSERVRAMEEVQRLPEVDRRALAGSIRSQPPEVAMRLWRALGAETANDADLVAAALRSTGPEARVTWLRAARELGVERFLALTPPLPADILVELLCPAASAVPASTALGLKEESRPERPTWQRAPDDLQAALDLSRHESHLVRAALAQWLANFSGADARRGIERLCEDRSGLVRLLAIRALRPRIAEKRDERAFLLPFLADPSPAVRAEALRSLAPVASPATDLAAWVRLYDPDTEVRSVATGYFLYRKLPWSVPYLLRVLSSTSSQTASQVEQALLADERPRTAVELATRLDLVPRAGMPIALRLLDGLARSAGLPGPSWLPVGGETPLPATLWWHEDRQVGAVRIVSAGRVQAKVQVSMDGSSWTDLGLYVLAKGEHVIPIGDGCRAVRVAREPSRASRLLRDGEPGPPEAPVFAATISLLTGPADPVAAWRAWAEQARPWLSGRAGDRLASALDAIELGNHDQAITHLNDCLREVPGHPIARLLTAQVLLERSASEPAARLLESLVEEYPTHASSLAALARVRELREDFAAARELLNRAIEADPAEPTYRSRRAALATKAGDHVIAVEHLAVAVALRPEDHILRFDYGYALFSAGEYADGLPQFRHVIERDPGNLDARYNVACGLARLGRADEALHALQEAVNAGFHDADFARKDPDLESVRSDPRFEGILSGDPSAGDFINNWK